MSGGEQLRDYLPVERVVLSSFGLSSIPSAMEL